LLDVEVFEYGVIDVVLVSGGDFLDLLHKTKALAEPRARYFYLQFGDALRYMHSVGFAHRDIKVSTDGPMCLNLSTFLPSSVRTSFSIRPILRPR